MREQTAYICDAIRTPFGRYGGSLASVRADDLAALPIAEIMARNPEIDWSSLDDVILGCANQAGEDNRNVARMASLLAGLPETVPGVTLNRLCGSSLEAIGSAARAIKSGEADLLIAGGVESMTRSPFVIGKSDSPFGRAQVMEDTTMGWRFINAKLDALYGTETMPETAENVAEKFNISREDQDAFAYRSQVRAAKAQESGLFDDEIMTVKIPQRRQDDLIFDKDEHPRATSMEALGKLKPFVKADGVITAGNASGINDGAAALLIASDDVVKAHGLKPMAKIIGMQSMGVEPKYMGIGPVSAVQKLLKRTGLTLAQMDVIELNEAFAAQALACMRELDLEDDAEHVNPNGGAIALGHPLGASGARLVITALHELKRRNGRYALCTMCIGVGQGIALIIEKI